MLKQWRINLKNKKKKENIEQEIKKLKKYSKFTSLVYSTIAICYYPIGLVFQKGLNSNSKNSKTIVKIDSKIDAIVSKNDKFKQKKINKIERKLVIVKDNVENKLKESKVDIKKNPLINDIEMIKQVERKIEYAKNPSYKIETKNVKIDFLSSPKPSNHSIKKLQSKIAAQEQHTNYKMKPQIQPNKKKTNNDSLTAKTFSKLDIKTKQMDNNTRLFKRELELNNIVATQILKPSQLENETNYVNEENQVDNSLSMTEELKKENIERLNKNAKEVIIKVELFNEQIKLITKYSDLYYIQNELNYLYNEVEKIKEEYNKLNLQTDKIYDFDEFNLRKNDLKLEDLKDYIKEVIESVEKRKVDILRLKKETGKEKLTVQKEKPKEEKKEDNKKEEKPKDDFTIAKQIVLQDIINHQNYLERNIKKIKSKNTLLGYIDSFFRKIISLNLILIPFTIIRNPMIFNLTNSILINNSLKTMHKLVNPTLDIRYEVLLDNYFDNKQIIMRTYNNYVNSLNELDCLENEIICYNPNEKLLNDISVVRNKIESEIKKIKEKNDIIDKTYIKLKEI